MEVNHSTDKQKSRGDTKKEQISELEEKSTFFPQNTGHIHNKKMESKRRKIEALMIYPEGSIKFDLIEVLEHTILEKIFLGKIEKRPYSKPYKYILD